MRGLRARFLVRLLKSDSVLVTVEEEEGDDVRAELTDNGSFMGLFRNTSPSRTCGLFTYIDCILFGVRCCASTSGLFDGLRRLGGNFMLGDRWSICEAELGDVPPFEELFGGEGEFSFFGETLLP